MFLFKKSKRTQRIKWVTVSNFRKIYYREDNSRMKILSRISSYKSKLRKIIIITKIIIILCKRSFANKNFCNQNSFCKQSCLTLKWEMLEVPQCKVVTGDDIKSEESHTCSVQHSRVWQNLQRLTTMTCSTNSVHKHKMWVNGPSFFFIHCISAHPKAVDYRILILFL